LKIWRENDNPFHKYKMLRKEDWTRFVEKCKLQNFVVNSGNIQ
jgi:hypothetical protein